MTRNPPALAIQREGEVDLALDVRPGLDVDAVDRQPRRIRLLGDEALAEHAFGRGPHAVQVPRHLDTAGLATSAGVHLRFHDPDRAAERLRCRHRLLDRGRQPGPGARECRNF